MTSADFKAARTAFGLTLVDFGRALAFEGNRNTLQVTVRRLESGARPVRPQTARLIEMYHRYGIPQDYIRDQREIDKC